MIKNWYGRILKKVPVSKNHFFRKKNHFHIKDKYSFWLKKNHCSLKNSLTFPQFHYQRARSTSVGCSIQWIFPSKKSGSTEPSCPVRWTLPASWAIPTARFQCKRSCCAAPSRLLQEQLPRGGRLQCHSQKWWSRLLLSRRLSGDLFGRLGPVLVGDCKN